MRLLFFLLLTIAVFPLSYSRADGGQCADIFLAKTPKKYKKSFEPTVGQVLEVYRRVEKFMDINVRNLRAKIDDPKIEQIVFEVTGHRKQLRSVFNYAKTLHPHEWWLEQLGMSVEQVYKKRAPLSEEQIRIAIEALKRKNLSLKVEAMRGNEEKVYTDVIAEALGYEVTASRVYKSSTFYDKTWTQWIEKKKAEPKPKIVKAPKIAEPPKPVKIPKAPKPLKIPRPKYTPTREQIVQAFVQLKLHGYKTTFHPLQAKQMVTERMALIQEAIGMPILPINLWFHARERLKLSVEQLSVEAETRILDSPIHTLIAVHERKNNWILSGQINLEVIAKIHSAYKKLQLTLTVQESDTLKYIQNYYAFSREWNPDALSLYVEKRLNFPPDALIESVLNKIQQDPELQALYQEMQIYIE